MQRIILWLNLWFQVSLFQIFMLIKFCCLFGELESNAFLWMHEFILTAKFAHWAVS